MKSNALFAIAEGVVGSVTKGQALQPQALNTWLRGLKMVVNDAGRFVEDDHLVTYGSDADDTEDTIQAAATYVYGFIAQTIDTAAQVVQLWDVATPTPGTTATGQHGTLQLPAASATTAPAAGGVLWFPYQYFGTTCLISSTDHSDYATGPGTSTVSYWVFWRNE